MTPLGRTWAGMAVGQALLTRGDRQYVGFYTPERNLVVAGRMLGPRPQDATDWSRQTLSTRLGWDSHNSVALGLDRDGAVHVAGNMHNVPLVYFRSDPGGDVTTLRQVTTMTDPATEGSVTYPQFLNRADGSLIFTHRDGGSGDGATYVNLYDERTASWNRLIDQPLFDGNGSPDDPSRTWSAYAEGPILGPDGLFHLLWVWRNTPDAATNSMLTYARSADLVTWTDSRDNTLATPFTYSAGDVVDAVPDHGGLLNGNARIGFDVTGSVLITYHKYDPAGDSQLYAARPGHIGWEIRRISDWRGRWEFGGHGTIDFEIALVGSEVLPNGDIEVNYLGHGRPFTIIVNPELITVTQLATSPLPDRVAGVRGTFAGLRVNVCRDSGYGLGSNTPRGTYVLRWESLGVNRDSPRHCWPSQGADLEVILLRPRLGS
ncbi:BNR repeat-containing protein [Streptomyces sp. NBC_01515]|uniref:BNR repeat-containing protein n=1 Tax=Streptomyces sp. NBC_01515 TaxID=2903890 RepID=UPI00386FA9F5